MCDACDGQYNRIDDPSTGGFTCQLDPSSVKAVLTLHTTGDPAVVGTAGTTQRTVTESILKSRIAQLLLITDVRVAVSITDSVSADIIGRRLANVVLIVTTTISPAASGSYEATSVADGNLLLTQSQDPSSAFTELLAYTTLAAVPGSSPALDFEANTLPPVCQPGTCSFPNKMMLGTNMAFAWRLDTAAQVLHMQLAFTVPDASQRTWFGIAFNDGPGMIPGDSIAVEPGKAAGQQINRYRLTGYTMSACPATHDATLLNEYSTFVEHSGTMQAWNPKVAMSRAAAGAAQMRAGPVSGFMANGSRMQDVPADDDWGMMAGTLTGSAAADALVHVGAVTSSSITTVATFSRKLTAASSFGVGSRSIDPTQDMYITWAWGPSGVLTLSSHTAETSGASVINLSAGAVTRYTWWVLLIHAVFAGAGLLVLLPVSALVTRYGRPDVIADSKAGRSLADAQTSMQASTCSAGSSSGSQLPGDGAHAFWRRAHTQISWLACACCTVGAAIGVWMVAVTPGGSHASSVHAQFGFATCAVIALLALSSFAPCSGHRSIRAHRDRDIERANTHADECEALTSAGSCFCCVCPRNSADIHRSLSAGHRCRCPVPSWHSVWAMLHITVGTAVLLAGPALAVTGIIKSGGNIAYAAFVAAVVVGLVIASIVLECRRGRTPDKTRSGAKSDPRVRERGATVDIHDANCCSGANIDVPSKASGSKAQGGHMRQHSKSASMSVSVSESRSSSLDPKTAAPINRRYNVNHDRVYQGPGQPAPHPREGSFTTATMQMAMEPLPAQLQTQQPSPASQREFLQGASNGGGPGARAFARSGYSTEPTTKRPLPTAPPVHPL